jgi:DNA-binding NarL/FixJ family response regulator
MTSGENSPRKRVLIVDDHPLVREWLTNLINQQSDLIVCAEAASAAEAMQTLPHAKPDAAVLDISLKDCSGLELIKDLKKASPHLVILVLSMHDEALYAERALRAGAKGYIMKQESTKKVIEALRRVLDGKFYTSEAITETITAQFAARQTETLRSPIERLSDRELFVFGLLADGRGTRQIAEHLRLSVKTVQAYCARIKEKLNLDSATDLIREAIRYKQTKELD